MTLRELLKRLGDAAIFEDTFIPERFRKNDGHNTTVGDLPSNLLFSHLIEKQPRRLNCLCDEVDYGYGKTLVTVHESDGDRHYVYRMIG